MNTHSDLLTRIEARLASAQVAHSIMLDRTAPAPAKDGATDDYVRCTDQIIADLAQLRAAGLFDAMRAAVRAMELGR